MKRVLLLLALCLLILGLAGCGTMERLLQDKGKDTFSSLLGNSPLPQQGTVNSVETRAVTVYFADPSGKNLVPVERQIPKTLSLARETMNELLKGPDQGSNLLPVLPQGVALLDINLKDQTAIVDFNKEITKPAAKVTQELTVYAIVNTLTQFPTVKQVKLRADGKVLQKLGSVDISQALTRNTSAVKKHPITQKPVSGSLLPAN